MGLMPKQPRRPGPMAAQQGQMHVQKRPAGKPVIVETENFTMRSLKASDVGPTFISWFEDPTVMAGLNLPEGGITRENLRGYVNEYDNQKKYLIGVFTKPDQRMVAYYSIDINREHKVAQISYVIGNSDYRSGHKLDEMYDVICDYFLENRSVDKLVARVVSTNYRALFMMKQSRFTFEAVLKKDNILPDGGRTDIVQFYRLRDGLD